MGRATCLAASTPKAAPKQKLKCHESPAPATAETAKKPEGCCCKKTPTLSSRNCGCHHGDSGWPVVRDQAMPARCDRIGTALPHVSRLAVEVAAREPRASDPPELPPPKLSSVVPA